MINQLIISTLQYVLGVLGACMTYNYTKQQAELLLANKEEKLNLALCGFDGNLQTLHPLNFLSRAVEAYIGVIVGGVMWPSQPCWSATFHTQYGCFSARVCEARFRRQIRAIKTTLENCL